MPVTVPRGPQPDTDEGLRQVAGALDRFTADHAPSSVEIYRHGRYVIRVRVVGEVFRDRSKDDRHRLVWGYLRDLPEDTLSDISVLLLLTPDEKGSSFASFEFDDPVPARF